MNRYLVTTISLIAACLLCCSHLVFAQDQDGAKIKFHVVSVHSETDSSLCPPANTNAQCTLITVHGYVTAQRETELVLKCHEIYEGKHQDLRVACVHLQPSRDYDGKFIQKTLSFWTDSGPHYTAQQRGLYEILSDKEPGNPAP